MATSAPDATQKQPVQEKPDAPRANGTNQKFGVNSVTYPQNLGSQDNLHFVTFNINVRGKSQYNYGNKTAVQRNPDSANLSRDQIGSAVAVGGGVAAGIAAGTIVKKIFNIIPKTGGKNPATALGGAAGTVAGAATGVAAGGLTAAAVNANSLLKPDTSYRISDAISLYLDGPPTVRYSMNYANKDLGALAGMLNSDVVKSLGSMDTAGEPAAALFANFAKLPGIFGVDLQSMLSASSGTSLNPFREVIFESVDFRSFNFNYKFMPKSKRESEHVNNIIRLFKFHMHPELSANKLFFIYPSEFQISYCFKGGPNTYFHKLAPCVLENMEVTYGGEQFSSFHDGTPVEVNMKLMFRETEILTKKMIEQGY